MTVTFFALGGTNWRKYLKDWDHVNQPLNALVTFADALLVADCRSVPWRRLMLDSGAYSAWNSGKIIDIEALTKATLDPIFSESVCLDVIGDSSASVANSLAMKAAGSPAFPVFHYGDPWEHLALYRSEFSRVGLSCRFGEPVAKSTAWLEQCFARAWPYRFHSFGWTAPDALARFPFDSCDSTSWKSSATWGRFQAIGRQHAKHFGFTSSRKIIDNLKGTFSLVSEIRSFLRVQRWLEFRWKKELEQCRR